MLRTCLCQCLCERWVGNITGNAGQLKSFTREYLLCPRQAACISICQDKKMGLAEQPRYRRTHASCCTGDKRDRQFAAFGLCKSKH